MKRLAEFAIHKTKITLFVALMLMGLGIYAFILIPKQDMPEIIPPVSSVQILAPGYSISDVQKYVTEPVEDAILSVDGVDYIDSITLDSIAIFTIVLEIDETNTKGIFDEIINKINSVSLPSNVLDPTMNNIIMSPHAIFSMTSESQSIEELTVSVEDFKNKLSEVDGVSSINIKGASDLQLYIDVDVSALNRIGLTMTDFMNIINYSGLEIPIGTLVTDDTTFGVQIPANYTSIQQVNNIIIGFNGQIPVKVSDVATITLQENVENITYVENGSNTIFIEFYFESGIDFTVLGNDLIEKQEAFSTNHPEVIIEQMVFQPDVVSASLNQVYSSLVIGVVLVIVVIFFGLGIRNAIGVGITFPLIITTTIGLMYLLGQDLQKITIAALIITIGIIVDNSIVISESIQHHLDLGKNKFDAAISSVKENSIPVLSSSLTTIAAFIPFMVISGVIGEMIRALPLTVAIAIGLSYFVAMLMMPVFGALFFKPNTKNKLNTKQSTNPFFTKIVPAIISRPILILSTSFVLLLLSVGFMLLRSEIELFPVEDDNIIYIDYSFQDINDKVGANAYALNIIDVLSSYEEIYYTAYSVGGDLPGFGARTQINNVPGEGRIFFRLNVPFVEVEDYVLSFIKDLEADENLVSTGTFLVKQLSMNFGGDADATIALSSYNYDELQSTIQTIVSELNLLGSVSQVTVQDEQLQERLVVNLDRNVLRSTGLTMIEVQQQITTNMNGGSFAIYEHNENVVSLNIQSQISTLEDFQTMLIKSSVSGNFIPLASIATFETESGVQVIKRHNGDHQVLIDVYFNEDANDVTATSDVISEVERLLGENITLNLGGQAELRNDTFSTLAVAAFFAILVVYFILFVQFNSFKTPIIILLTVPLSFIGSALLVGITATPISFTMIFGITSLIGIVVNMGILLIDHIDRARNEGASVLEACTTAVQRRLRPILLSSVTTVMGLIPLALFGGAFFIPMAVSLMGGLIASTILTLFVVPATYYLLEK